MSSTYLPRQIETGSGSLKQLGKISLENGANHLFVIMDAFLVSSQLRYDQKIKRMVQEENLGVTFFTAYQGEPTTDHVKTAIKLLEKSHADCVVAVGGGSAIDIAKAVSTFAKRPAMRWEEITVQPKLYRLPLIAVPTTAGTGSEATKVMVITNTQTNIKMNPGHRDLVPDVSILDPELTLSLPKHFTAYTGMDALAHAMEAYVSNRATGITDNYALSAMKAIGKALPKVYEDGEDVKARGAMLIASCYAGIAFSNASTNLAHAAARPLGARFHIPHGLSVALLLPFVMKFGLEAVKERYADIAVALGEQKLGSSQELAERAVIIIENYNEQFHIWEDGLKFIDIDDLRENTEVLVEDALSGNGIATNRKLPLGKDVESIYHSLSEKLERTRKAHHVS